MQENRSFDHYFGTLRGVRGFGDPRPLQWADGRTVWQQPNARVRTPTFQARGVAPDAPYVLPFHIDTRRTGDQQDGTDHSWSTGHQAWNHGRWNDWVTQKQDALTMGYLKREDLRVPLTRWPRRSPCATAISARRTRIPRSTASTCGRAPRIRAT